MNRYLVLPEGPITGEGAMARAFVACGIKSFKDAGRYVHELPYGYNSNRDDPMILFKEKMGTCTTKHAVIATLALEMALPVFKYVGIYAMTEELVLGTSTLLAKFKLPCIPMLHCFLVYGTQRVDLTEGNRNGKKCPIEDFLHVQQVSPNISAKDEYLLYRKALNDVIMKRPEFRGIDLKRILQAREEGLKLLKANIA